MDELKQLLENAGMGESYVNSPGFTGDKPAKSDKSFGGDAPTKEPQFGGVGDEGTGYDDVEEAVKDWDQQKEYHVEDSSGDQYSISFEDRNGVEAMFVEANGVAIAYGEVGGAGTMKASIKDPAALMDALFAFANNNDR